jgi:hypothetical protein
VTGCREPSTAGLLPLPIKNQKSKIKNQKSKIKNQKSKIKNQKSKIVIHQSIPPSSIHLSSTNAPTSRRRAGDSAKTRRAKREHYECLLFGTDPEAIHLSSTNAPTSHRLAGDGAKSRRAEEEHYECLLFGTDPEAEVKTALRDLLGL